MSRDRLAALVAAIAVILTLILGFRELGAPRNQRLVRSDLRTLQTLSNLAAQINTSWQANGHQLPPDLQKFSTGLRQNPLTDQPFRYRPKSGSDYELCATFLTDNRSAPRQNPRANEFWIHPRGDYCFQLDAAQTPTAPPYDY